jgi:molecular chaperone GrpE
MSKTNGRSEVEKPVLDVEHELPAAANDVDDNVKGVSVSEESSRPDSELQKLRDERDALLDRLSRAQAEFENARRRAAKEQQDFREYAIADAIKSLLPVLDSLERALQVKSDEAELRSGVELIHKQLLAALAKLSVNPIASKGETFDPHYHQAVEMVETTEVPDHEVLEELQRGYKFKDRLLRPAMVKVARNSAK